MKQLIMNWQVIFSKCLKLQKLKITDGLTKFPSIRIMGSRVIDSAGHHSLHVIILQVIIPSGHGQLILCYISLATLCSVMSL